MSPCQLSTASESSAPSGVHLPGINVCFRPAKCVPRQQHPPFHRSPSFSHSLPHPLETLHFPQTRPPPGPTLQRYWKRIFSKDKLSRCWLASENVPVILVSGSCLRGIWGFGTSSWLGGCMYIGGKKSVYETSQDIARSCSNHETHFTYLNPSSELLSHNWMEPKTNPRKSQLPQHTTIHSNTPPSMSSPPI